MAEGQSNIHHQDTESANQRQCSRGASAETFNLATSEPKFPKILVQPESSQSKSFSSSEDFSSPLFKPRRRLRSECSDSEGEEEVKHPAVELSSSDDKNAN